MTNNYFATIHKNAAKKEELLDALRKLWKQEDEARSNYIQRVESLIRSRPGLTAHQYAIMLSDDPKEQASIRTSIGMLGQKAEEARSSANFYLRTKCYHPSVPSLVAKPIFITRHFLEVDENGNPLGKFDMVEKKNTYSMKD